MLYFAGWIVGIALTMMISGPPPQVPKALQAPKPVRRRVAPPHARGPTYITKPDGPSETRACQEERQRLNSSSLPCGPAENRRGVDSPKGR